MTRLVRQQATPNKPNCGVSLLWHSICLKSNLVTPALRRKVGGEVAEAGTDVS